MLANEQLLSTIENYLAQTDFASEPENSTPPSATRWRAAANGSARCC